MYTSFALHTMKVRACYILAYSLKAYSCKLFISLLIPRSDKNDLVEFITKIQRAFDGTYAASYAESPSEINLILCAFMYNVFLIHAYINSYQGQGTKEY